MLGDGARAGDVPALALAAGLSRSCQELVDDQGPRGGTGNSMSDGTLAGKVVVVNGSNFRVVNVGMDPNGSFVALDLADIASGR